MAHRNIIEIVLATYLFMGVAIGAVIGLVIAAIMLGIGCAAYAYFW